MITLYTWKTPNGRKASVALEELGLAYTVVPVDISKGEQHDPAYLRLNPNNKIPTIVDEEGVDVRTVVFETGAILAYLAAKTGRLMPREGQAAADALSWLTWTVSSLSPMLGRWNGFTRMDPPDPAGLEVFAAEAVRLFGVLERRLGQHPFLSGEYGMADISAYTWTAGVLPMFREKTGDRLGATPNIDRWLEEIGARPAVKRGMAVPDV